MIATWKPVRWLKKQIHRIGIKARVECLRTELLTSFPEMTSLRRSPHEGGYDSIFMAYRQETPIAIVRLNNRFKSAQPIWSGRPRQMLSPKARLDHEWTMNQRLSDLGLGARPLWRCEDAIACACIDAPRLRTILEQGLMPIEQALDVAFDAVNRMHDHRLSHQDLTPGNILICPRTLQVTLIDFEYGALPGRTFEQQCEFDLLLFMAKVLERAVVLNRFAEFDKPVAESFLRSHCAHRLSSQAFVDETMLDLDPDELSNRGFKDWFEKRIAPALRDRDNSKVA